MLEELEGELSLLYDCLPREEIEKVDSSKGEKVAKRGELYTYICSFPIEESKRLVRKGKRRRKEGRKKYFGAGRNYEEEREGTRRREKGVVRSFVRSFVPMLVKAAADNRY